MVRHRRTSIRVHRFGWRGLVVLTAFILVAPAQAAHARGTTPAGPKAGAPQVETFVSIPFDPAVHGFSFANWADLGAADDATVNVVRRLFGDASVCRSVAGATCTPHPGVGPFLARLNQALTAGRCEGIVVAAFARFRAATPGANAATMNSVLEEINYWSSTQILPAARTAVKETRSLGLSDLVSRLTTSLRNGGGDVVGLSATGISHTVLPISIRQKGTTVTIGVYDSNHPRTTQQIEIDLAKGNWLYRPRNAAGKVAFDWTGQAGSLSLVPFASRAPAPTNSFRTAA